MKDLARQKEIALNFSCIIVQFNAVSQLFHESLCLSMVTTSQI